MLTWLTETFWEGPQKTQRECWQIKQMVGNSGPLVSAQGKPAVDRSKEHRMNWNPWCPYFGAWGPAQARWPTENRKAVANRLQKPPPRANRLLVAHLAWALGSELWLNSRPAWTGASVSLLPLLSSPFLLFFISFLPLSWFLPLNTPMKWTLELSQFSRYEN